MAQVGRQSARPAGGAGRPLDQSRDPVIMRAALEGVAEVGYDRLTMDDIASRAHAGKGALYRRWPSKASLVIDAVVAWRQQLAPQEAPDTGSLRGDLDALVALVPDWDDDSRRMASVVGGLVTAARHDPELAAAFSGPVVEMPLGVIRTVLERAVGRGEIPPGRDIGLVAEAILALNVFRMVIRNQPPDRHFIRRVVDEIVYPLVTAPVPSPGRSVPSREPAQASRRTRRPGMTPTS